MIYINTPEIGNLITDYNNIISEYELTYLNLFNELQNSNNYWQDNISKQFYDKMLSEKKETHILINILKEKKDIYQFLFDKYSSLGKKIKCNLDSKDSFISHIDNCISEIDKIIKIFDNIDMTKNFRERDKINNQKNRMFSIRTNYLTIKSNVKSQYNNIEEIENEIQKRIDKIRILKIEDFNEDLYL